MFSRPERPFARGTGMTAGTASLLDRRLVIVSGKGGVGKTAIACAVAEAARRAGKRVLLAETSPIEAVAGRFEQKARPLGYAGRTLAPGLDAMRIDPHEALADYVRLQTRLGLITDRVLQTQAFRELLEAAPGWRELIILGKTWHLEQQTDRRGRPTYDLIVVNAPATGHGLTFLDVPRVVQNAIRSGPLTRHAGWVEEMVHDRARTVLLPVTLPEELPVSETIELVARARREIDIGVDRVVVNRWPLAPPAGLVDALARVPDAIGLEALPEPVRLRELAAHAQARIDVARAERARVATACDLPIVEFPLLGDGFGPDQAWTQAAERVLDVPTTPDEDERSAGADTGSLGEDAA